MARSWRPTRWTQDKGKTAEILQRIADATEGISDDSPADAQLRDRLELAADVLDAVSGTEATTIAIGTEAALRGLSDLRRLAEAIAAADGSDEADWVGISELLERRSPESWATRR